jgi:hypothetical protein
MLNKDAKKNNINEKKVSISKFLNNFTRSGEVVQNKNVI